MLLPPLLSVRVPTYLAILRRARFCGKSTRNLSRRNCSSIIVFRLDALGDVVMTTPLFRELKRTFPRSRCTAVVQPAFRSLLLTNPYIDEILSPPEIRPSCLPQCVKRLLGALLLGWKYLRKRRFDIVISPRWDVDGHLATLLCLLTNATRRVGYTEKASPLKQRLNRGFDAAFDLCLASASVKHEVVRNLAVVEALGGTVQDGSPEVRLTEGDRAFAASLLSCVSSEVKVIALGIGAGARARCWPLQCYAESISELQRHLQVLPVILCSLAECGQASQLQKLLNGEAIILSGTPLRQVCAVLERCDLFIGNDSGPSHLAAAVDCKTIVVSCHPQSGAPNHSNSPVRFAPYGENARVLQPATGLDSCTDHCQVREPHCITAVRVIEVVVAARAMLSVVPAAHGHKSAKPSLHHPSQASLAVILYSPTGSSIVSLLGGTGRGCTNCY